VGRGAETTPKLKYGDRTARRLMGAAVARKQQIDPTCQTPSEPTHQIESPTPGKVNHITIYNSCALTAHAGREETLEKCPYPRPLYQNINVQHLIVGGIEMADSHPLVEVTAGRMDKNVKSHRLHLVE
jgi:hypothetical protein